ncbi:uncharacterized protein A1O5_01135 [Cladophialophora psammophila CBS 110553]|uniref:Uncharacterized protein n=1 Tax=Cladophialophora psammophila CBS 110553 TaxID=1182543 RepID=W9X816_9EURO|nr:uncharacterized protein A1O5_01135 [Cladophialophora psammophila CBS 110553]EXJ76627.1 hypothetical protein A1O5_01135 [Cladophialophora psammophila CBS 110553]
MFSREERVVLEQDGVHIGGWSVRNLLVPSKKDGQKESSEDRVQAVNGLVPDWSQGEERALVRKLDIRILAPCFVIYVLAYLDRGNIGSVKVLQIGKPDSIERSLHMKGTEFNWVSQYPQDQIGDLRNLLSYDDFLIAINPAVKEDVSQGLFSCRHDRL